MRQMYSDTIARKKNNKQNMTSCTTMSDVHPTAKFSFISLLIKTKTAPSSEITAIVNDNADK